jgi:hypothetical protein
MAKCKSLGNNNNQRILPFKCNIVVIAEEGREAFMQWLNSDDKKSTDNHNHFFVSI